MFLYISCELAWKSPAKRCPRQFPIRSDSSNCWGKKKKKINKNHNQVMLVGVGIQLEYVELKWYEGWRLLFSEIFIVN